MQTGLLDCCPRLDCCPFRSVNRVCVCVCVCPCLWPDEVFLECRAIAVPGFTHTARVFVVVLISLPKCVCLLHSFVYVLTSGPDAQCTCLACHLRSRACIWVLTTCVCVCVCVCVCTTARLPAYLRLCVCWIPGHGSEIYEHHSPTCERATPRVFNHRVRTLDFGVCRRVRKPRLHYCRRCSSYFESWDSKYFGPCVCVRLHVRMRMLK